MLEKVNQNLLMLKIISQINLMVAIVIISIATIKPIAANNLHYDQFSKDQKIFVDTINKYRNEFDPASNDLKKNKLLRNRNEDLCGPSFDASFVFEWIGKIKDISTNLDGKGILAVEIDKNIRIETWNNAFSDIFNNTLIEIDTSVYDQLIDLEINQVILFDGNFFPNDECIESQNLLTNSKIMKPSYTFKFSNLEPFN